MATAVCEPVSVKLGAIEGELDRQLKKAQGPGEAPLVRARMSNLVIYTEQNELCDFAASIVPELVSLHPARVILLFSDASRVGDQVDATVVTRVADVTKGLRAFSELITLKAGPGAREKLPFAVRRLFLGDLPSNLWWAVHQPPAMASSIVHGLTEGINQFIYDSYSWPEPARGVAATATWLERFDRNLGAGAYRVAQDLTWRRLRPWRRLIAEALDPATAPGALESITEILFDHGPHSVTYAWSLASWIVLRLGWRVTAVKINPGNEFAWTLASPGGTRVMRVRRLASGERGIHWVRIACTINGKSGALNLAPADNRRLKIEPEGFPGITRTVTVPPMSQAELVARQLSDRESDPIFRASMGVAQDLALRVLQQK
jgi:glucose-6-phosphate dehydrogenase assembly protein OpcA